MNNTKPLPIEMIPEGPCFLGDDYESGPGVVVAGCIYVPEPWADPFQSDVGMPCSGCECMVTEWYVGLYTNSRGRGYCCADCVESAGGGVRGES